MSIALLKKWLGASAPSPFDSDLKRDVRNALIEHDALLADLSKHTERTTAALFEAPALPPKYRGPVEVIHESPPCESFSQETFDEAIRDEIKRHNLGANLVPASEHRAVLKQLREAQDLVRDLQQIPVHHGEATAPVAHSNSEAKPIEEIRKAFLAIHRYATSDNAPTYMSVPADPERDADLILSAAIDELERLRACVKLATPPPETEDLARDLAAMDQAVLRLSQQLEATDTGPIPVTHSDAEILLVLAGTSTSSARGLVAVVEQAELQNNVLCGIAFDMGLQSAENARSFICVGCKEKLSLTDRDRHVYQCKHHPMFQLAAERDRLAAGALSALSGAGVCTPERGYTAEPYMLAIDIGTLARERNAHRADAERFLKQIEALKDALARPWLTVEARSAGGSVPTGTFNVVRKLLPIVDDAHQTWEHHGVGCYEPEYAVELVQKLNAQLAAEIVGGS